MDEGGQLTAAISKDADGALVVRLAGELDMCTYDLAATAVETAVHRTGSGGLAIDLSALTFIDAGGVRVMARLRNWSHETGVPLSLRGAHGVVARVLSLCGLTTS